VRWKLRHSFRYRKRRESPTDYLAEFDHRSLRKAKASILWFEDWDKATGNHLYILQELGLIQQGCTVVDYGCGIGRITLALAEHGGVRVIAVDRSAEMRAHARRYISQKFFDLGTVRLLSDVEFLNELPLLRGSIDTLLFMEVLQHIPEPVIDDLLPKILPVLQDTAGRMFIFGNEQLDVSADGGVFPDTPTIESVLLRHCNVLRKDSWENRFSAVRWSFLCALQNSARGAARGHGTVDGP
jgi:SAM-dependent methyltransferase